jgi:transposase
MKNNGISASNTGNTSKNNPNCIGLDVGKATHFVFLEGTFDSEINNDPKGIARFVSRCKKVPDAFVICEATGGYQRPVVAALRKADVNVAVVHPARVRWFAKANGISLKNDHIDARLLARFGREADCLARPAETPLQLKQRDLADLRRHLVEQITVLKGKQENALPQTLKALREELAWQEKRLRKADAALAALAASDATLAADIARLQTVKGIGPVMAHTLLAYVPEVKNITSRTLGKLVGVAPDEQSSGTIVKPAHIHGGRKNVRDVLYMSAVSCVRYNPILKAFYEGLLSRGKSKKLGLVAVMRKLLELMHRLVNNPDFTLA